MSRHAKQAADRFDSWAQSYGEDRISGWFRHYQSVVLSKLDFQKGSFLDVGCGVGWAVREAARRHAGGQACGIDISPRMIAKAKELSGEIENVEFRVANAEEIPYPDETFASVICTCSIHHYENPSLALKEIRRVTMPGGRFVVLDSARDLSWAIWLQDRFRRYFERSHVRYYTTAEMRELLRAAGWSIEGDGEQFTGFLQHRKTFTGLMLFACAL